MVWEDLIAKKGQMMFNFEIQIAPPPKKKKKKNIYIYIIGLSASITFKIVN